VPFVAKDRPAEGSFAEPSNDKIQAPQGAQSVLYRGDPRVSTPSLSHRPGGRRGSRRWNDSTANNQIIRVGTAKGETRSGADDPHPEYVADDYLVLLQGTTGKARPAPRSIGSSRGGGGDGRSGAEAGKNESTVGPREAGFSHYCLPSVTPRTPSKPVRRLPGWRRRRGERKEGLHAGRPGSRAAGRTAANLPVMATVAFSPNSEAYPTTTRTVEIRGRLMTWHIELMKPGMDVLGRSFVGRSTLGE